MVLQFKRSNGCEFDKCVAFEIIFRSRTLDISSANICNNFDEKNVTLTYLDRPYKDFVAEVRGTNLYITIGTGDDTYEFECKFEIPEQWTCTEATLTKSAVYST